MHHITAGQHVIDRVMVRRGRYHWFEILDPKRSALVVIDMQNTFCEPGSPSEVQGSREIVPSINALSARLRDRGVPIISLLHANTHAHGRSDWELFFNNVVADEVRQRTIDSLAPGRQAVWKDLHTHSADITLIKNRYSALVLGSFTLERVLRNLEHRHPDDCWHQDPYLLRSNGARRDDAGLQGRWSCFRTAVPLCLKMSTVQPWRTSFSSLVM